MRGSLDELFAALRAEGVPVGTAEVARTCHALAAGPRLDREGLRRFLAFLLVKRPEHQGTFDRLFEVWCPDLPAEDWLGAGERGARRPGTRGIGDAAAPGGAEAEAPRPEEVRRRLPLRLGYAAAALLVGCLALWLLGQDWWQRKAPPIDMAKPPEPVVHPLPPEEEPAGDELPSRPAPYIRYWRAEVDPDSVIVPARIGPEGLAGIGMLFALAALHLAYRHRRLGRLRPKPLPSPRGGPGWMPLPAREGSDTLLASARERRAMSWNIARFTAEDRTRRVDERATAIATARAGGVPEVRYRHAKYPREVWLLSDARCEVPELTELLDEVGSSLRRGGLTVRLGSFAGTPARMWWGRGDPFSFSTEEGRRDQVMVAVLTDGAELLRALRAPARRKPVAQQMRTLALWPHAVVVDFSAGTALARALAPLRLQRILPRDLPAWLGGRAAAASVPSLPRLQGDLLIWAGACALSPDPVDEAAAQRLRGHLGVAADAWQIADLRRHAGGTRLAWTPEARRLRVNELLRAGFDPTSGRLRPDSSAHRAISWWIERYREADTAQRRRQSPLLPWADTEAERRWDLESALLRLYLDPSGAVPELAALAGAGLRGEVRGRLAELRTWDMEPEPEPADGEGNQDDDTGDWRGRAIHLPWRWDDFHERGEMLDALLRLGFGGRSLAERLRFRPPPRSALALGALAGLALAAFTAAGILYHEPPGITFVSSEPMLDKPALWAQTLRLPGEDDDAGTVVVGHAKWAKVLTGLPAGSRVPVTWHWGTRGPEETKGAPEPNNPVVPYEGSSGLLFVGGTLAEPVRPCDPDWPARFLAVIAADPEDRDARRLAIELLDSGNADLALIGEDWRRDLRRLPERHPVLDQQTQLLVLVGPGARETDPDWSGPWAMVGGDYGVAAGVVRRLGLKRPYAGLVAELVFLKGDVEVRDAKTGDWSAAIPAHRLFAGDEIRTGADGSVSLLLRDEGRISLGPGKRWTYPLPEKIQTRTRSGIHDLSDVPSLHRLAGEGRVLLHGGPTKTTDPETGITWVRLCASTFTMGTADADPPEAVAMRRDDEQPAHRVSLSAFEIAETEVTNGQYRRLVPDHNAGEADDLPAVRVTWEEAAAFCREVGGALPTEAQWEHAARAGSRAPWFFGLNGERMDRYAWSNENSGVDAQPVAGKKPNRFGLHDMHGNVWEWVGDWYGEYGADPRLDPEGPQTGVYRVLRGGSFYNPPEVLRSADRFDDEPMDRNPIGGFRCVRVPARQH